ncbi:hypothetical protein PMIN01_04070 [Paraphaeosphaeria minitans]|uniref:Uncharacterized protein n=1 Tax=Paraphaeosphaeria minitans TaxID=565426 RepID=A0A9P6KTY0_9PLEO|nr:hypothetical protein PMIN01_04070 [Paraphaeosphaeria minitans]
MRKVDLSTSVKQTLCRVSQLVCLTRHAWHVHAPTRHSVKQSANTSRLCPRKPRAILYRLVADGVAVEVQRLHSALLYITVASPSTPTLLPPTLADPLLVLHRSLQAHENTTS